jgi:hypothetical protein
VVLGLQELTELVVLGLQELTELVVHLEHLGLEDQQVQQEFKEQVVLELRVLAVPRELLELQV